MAWTEALQSYGTLAVADKRVAVIGTLSAGWIGENGVTRMDPSEHFCFVNDKFAIRLIEETDFD